jgi:hypothetical protein
MLMNMDQATTALVVGALGKLFIMAADSMPAPPENCSYFVRWFYDFVQRLASNSAKVGATKDNPLAGLLTRVGPTPAPPAAK